MENSNSKDYKILVYQYDKENDNLIPIIKLNLINIENKTIKELKELLYKKIKEYCPCKLKLFNGLEDGIFYSYYNDTPYKKIKECFPKKIIYFLFCDAEKCECDLENKELLNLTKSELINKVIETQNQLKKRNLLINELKSQIEKKNNVINKYKFILQDIERKNKLVNIVNELKVQDIEELNQDLLNYIERSVNIMKKRII